MRFSKVFFAKLISDGLLVFSEGLNMLFNFTGFGSSMETKEQIGIWSSVATVLLAPVSSFVRAKIKYSHLKDQFALLREDFTQLDSQESELKRKTLEDIGNAERNNWRTILGHSIFSAILFISEIALIPLLIFGEYPEFSWGISIGLVAVIGPIVQFLEHQLWLNSKHQLFQEQILELKKIILEQKLSNEKVKLAAAELREGKEKKAVSILYSFSIFSLKNMLEISIAKVKEQFTLLVHYSRAFCENFSREKKEDTLIRSSMAVLEQLNFTNPGDRILFRPLNEVPELRRNVFIELKFLKEELHGLLRAALEVMKYARFFLDAIRANEARETLFAAQATLLEILEKHIPAPDRPRSASLGYSSESDRSEGPSAMTAGPSKPTATARRGRRSNLPNTVDQDSHSSSSSASSKKSTPRRTRSTPTYFFRSQHSNTVLAQSAHIPGSQPTP